MAVGDIVAAPFSMSFIATDHLLPMHRRIALREGYRCRMTRTNQTPHRLAPAWLADLFPKFMVDASPLRWGFRNESWKVTLADGRRLAVTRLIDGRSAGVVPALVAAVQPRFADVGLPVPALVARSTPWPEDVLVTDYLEGEPGAVLLSTRSGPRSVGAMCGATWLTIRQVDPTGLGLPDLWASPDKLAREARAWAAALGTALGEADRIGLEDSIARLPGLLSGRPVTVVHGDLVPVNVLVRDGRLVALLDLESVRLADPVLDAAWFDRIVWFHHPTEHPEAWAGFTRAAGLDKDEPITQALLQVLPVIRILELSDGLGPGAPTYALCIQQLQAFLRAGPH